MYKLLLFAGTTEGRELAEYLAGCKVQVTACVATEYGETLISPQTNLTVHAGRMDRQQMQQLIQQMLPRILLLRMPRQQMRTRMLILLRQMLQRATAQRKLIPQTALTVQTRLQKRTVQTARPRTAARALILRRTQRILQKRQLRRTKSEIKIETCCIVCIAKCFLKELRLYKVEIGRAHV